MSDLIALLDTLVDVNGKILIPGVYDSVAPLDKEEEQLYEAIEFDMVRHATPRTRRASGEWDSPPKNIAPFLLLLALQFLLF